jgi:hypothetical protein
MDENYSFIQRSIIHRRLQHRSFAWLPPRRDVRKSLGDNIQDRLGRKSAYYEYSHFRYHFTVLSKPGLFASIAVSAIESKFKGRPVG